MGSPIYFIQFFELLVLWSVFYEKLNRLNASLQSRSIYRVKTDMIKRTMKGEGLLAAKLIERGINTTSLYDPLTIKVCLSVTNQVNSLPHKTPFSL
jgi:hypothetical protein